MFAFFKKNKNRSPSLKSLHSSVFNVEKFWFLSLGVTFFIIVFTALLGIQLAYPQYFESYKKNNQTEDNNNYINVDRLNRAIEKRNNLINQEIFLPKDPS